MLKGCMHAQSLSHVQLFATPLTVAHQAPLSTEFPRQEYWSRLSFPSPEDLPHPGIEPTSAALQADSSLLRHWGSPVHMYICIQLEYCGLVAKSYPTLSPHWTVASPAHPSMVFSRQEHWSGFPFPFLRNLPNPEIKPTFPVLAGRFFTTEPPGKPLFSHRKKKSLQSVMT